MGFEIECVPLPKIVMHYLPTSLIFVFKVSKGIVSGNTRIIFEKAEVCLLYTVPNIPFVPVLPYVQLCCIFAEAYVCFLHSYCVN